MEGRITDGLPGVPWCYSENTDPSRWADVEAILVGSLERELNEFASTATPRLRFVQRIYTGVDGFPFDRFPAQVKIAGNVGAYAPFVAEHAVALALAAARQLPLSQARVRAGQLRPPPLHRLLFGRAATILGYGEIGRAIAHRLAPFGTRVVGVNRTGRMAAGCDAVFPADHLVEAVRSADFVFEARPLTRATRGSVGKEVFSAMRPHAVFVNVGRAATVDEESLYRHLVENPEFRAAIDVWWSEDFPNGRLTSRFPFSDLPNFIGTPHVAGLGEGVETYVLDRALENLARFFRGEEPLYVVDRTEYVES
jgi:phosphoglycerate dehydrogenase-like enzyme